MALVAAASRSGDQCNVARHGVHASSLQRFAAGADVFSRQSDGTTIAAQYATLGFTLRRANTDRVNGWAEIVHRLGDVDAGIKPTLFIHRRCARLLDCLPSLQRDPNRLEDVMKVDADDEASVVTTLRTRCITWSRRSRALSCSES